jgi:APA family basic amino acid/polyamine antiporter
MNRPAAVPGAEPRRVLGLWDATCIVIGAIIGVGIFFVPRGVAGVTGSAGGALLAWGLGGIVAMLGALAFAELGRMRPVAGSQYHILREAYGRAPAFLFVFCNLTAVQAGGVAIIAIICAQNLEVVFGGAHPGATVPWVASLLVAVLAATNVVGTRAGARVQNTTVAIKLLVFVALIAIALVAHPASSVAAPSAVVSSPLRFSSLFAGVTLTLFAYGGWQQGLWMAGEVVDAARTVSRAILIGVAVVVAAYLSANWAYLHLLGFEGVRHATVLAADAFSVVSPGFGRRLAAAAVAISSFGVLNAQLLAGPRLTWAMAREGQFFGPFARLHPKFGTPVAAILLLAAIGTALLLGLGLERTDQLTTGVVVIDATFFALTGLALPLLRRRTGAHARGPGWIDAAAVAFAILELLAIAGSLLQQNVRLLAWSGLGWIGAAAITWVIWFRSSGERVPGRPRAG